MAKDTDIFDEKSPEAGDNSGAVAADELRSYVERFERLDEQKQEILDDQKELKAEAKGRGYCMKTFAEMLRLRKMDAAERQEREALRDLYASALGIFG